MSIGFENHALMMSCTVMPPGIIGSTCSWYGTMHVEHDTAPCCRASLPGPRRGRPCRTIAAAPHAEALGDRHEVGYGSSLEAGAEVGVAAVAVVEAVLPLHHHAQVLVVEQQHLDRQLLA